MKEHPPFSSRFQGVFRFWWIPALVLASALAMATAIIPKDSTFDYPVALLSAERILAGETPYVNYAVLYGPLGHYLTAVALWVSGGLLPAQAANLFFGACAILILIVSTAFLVMLRRHRPGVADSLLLCLLILSPMTGLWSYYSGLPTLLVALAILASCWTYSQRAQRSTQITGAFILAAVAVCTLLTRLNFGMYLFFGVGVAACCSLGVDGLKDWRRHCTICVAVLLVLLVGAAILAHFGILQPYLEDMAAYLAGYKSRRYPLHLRLQESGWNVLQLALIGLLILALLHAAWILIRRRKVGASIFAIFAVLPFVHYAALRYDMEHIYPLFVLLPLLAGIVVSDLTGSGESKSVRPSAKPLPERWPAGALLGSVLLLTASFAPTSMEAVTWAKWFCTNSGEWLSPLPREDSNYHQGVNILSEETAMLRALPKDVRGDRRILWANVPGTCESTTQTGANIALYVAQGVLPTTAVWFFDTPSTPYPDVQRRLIADVETRQIPRIAMQGMIDPTIGYLPGNPLESTLFFDYVRSHYDFLQRFSIPKENRYFDIYIRRER